MASLLTSAELDALRAAAPSRPRRRLAGSGAVPFDFRRRDRLAKEQVHALQFLHDRCARNMSTSFSAYLRTTVSLSVAAVDQMTYEEFLRSLADPTAFYALGIAPFDELGALEINPAIAFALIDRMLGGSGQPAPVNRPLTEIEQNVVDTVVKLLLEGLAEAWKPVTNLAFSIRARETRPQMLQVSAPNESVVVIVLQMQVGGIGGFVNLCLPASVVVHASAQFVQAWPKQRRETGAAEQAWLVAHVAEARVPVEALVRSALTTQTLMHLQVGQVLTLSKPADQPIEIAVGGLRKFRGHLGADRGRLKAVVDDRLEPALPVVRETE